MEKNAILGEILYIGLVFEKGRCNASGIWKRTYIQNLSKHIRLLKEVSECMKNSFQIVEDNILLKKVCNEILDDENLKKHYPFCGFEEVIKSNEKIITECREENKCNEIVDFINQLLGDILLELGKGIRKDKQKIIKMIFSAHNLPRVYLSKDISTLCLMGRYGIGPEEALKYAKLSMDEGMMIKYNSFLKVL